MKNIIFGRKTKVAGFLFASLALATIAANSTFAAPVSTTKLFTDSNNVRWEIERIVDNDNIAEPESVSIKFYDKPAAMTTIVVPSLSDVLAAIPEATQTLDTYYVKNADQAFQAATYTEPEQAKRLSSADVTVLDMTNTSKVQILGVQPIINPDVETELIFGENMVIGDGIDITVRVDLRVCGRMGTWSSGNYYCEAQTDTVLTLDNTLVSNWNYLSVNDKINYRDLEALGYYNYERLNDDDSPISYDPSFTYYDDYGLTFTTITTGEGAFSGYKLKLTNFGGFNYVGWYAFKDSVFDESNTTITIDNDAFMGEEIFANTNVQKAIVNGNNPGVGLFRNCTSLTEVEFGENVNTIGFANYNGTSITSLDLSNTNVETIRDYAFANSKLTSLNLGNIQRIDSYAFKENDLSEIYLPKTINKLAGGIFYGNFNLKKATVAYDTLTSGTLLQFFVVLDGIGYMDTDYPEPYRINKLEELVVLAPYEEDEALKETHISYREYREHQPYIRSSYATLYNNRYHADSESQYIAESEYANLDSYKNIIAPLYFSELQSLKKITIGEGYEYIGTAAFYDRINDDGYSSWDDLLGHEVGSMPGQTKAMEKIVLPESLKGVGSIVITSVFNEDFEMNLPSGLEFIGFGAFRRLFNWDVDLDLPNLKFLGDYAFYSTKVHDIYLHDKLEYLGVGVFNDCPAMHDIVFDFDIFGENAFPWWLNGSTSQKLWRNLAGARHERYYIKEALDHYGFDYIEKKNIGTGYDYILTINSITFTGKSTRPLAMCENMGVCYDSMMSFFGHISVEKVDMSKAQWDFIPVHMFNDSFVGEVILPENLKEIHANAFANAIIREEIVLPETLEVIEDSAFQQYRTRIHFNRETIKITKLPKSLKKIGTLAFYYDDRLNLAEFDLPNLEVLGNIPFASATIENIVLHDSFTQFGIGAFWHIFGTKNITIDFDIFNQSSRPGTGAYVAVMSTNAFISGRTGYGINPYLMSSYFTLYEPYEVIRNDWGIESSFSYHSELGGVNEKHQYENITFTDKNTYNPGNGTTYVKAVGPCREWETEYDEQTCVDQWENYRSRIYDKEVMTGQFYGVKANKIDLGQTAWTEMTINMFGDVEANEIILPNNITYIPVHAFYGATVNEPVAMPSGITEIRNEAFQYSNLGFDNAFAEGLTTIAPSAFYGADIHGDITLPSTVNAIGASAFNAGETDTHYGTVTIKPALDYSKTSDQAIFQMFWNASMDKLVIESPMLPVLGTLQAEPVLPDDIEVDGEMVSPLRADGEPEFHGMTMREVEIKNLPIITANAFEECANLETVSFANHTNLSEVGKFAFNNDTKLKKFVFGDGLVGKDVALKEYAFNNTAVETIGNHNTGFDLTAANFNAVEPHVFSNMPKLTYASIPSTFSIQTDAANPELNTNGATIPAYTFADDPELATVELSYLLSKVEDGAFLNDNKLTKLFVWGNTTINENDSELTVPEVTNIFAYSDAPAENYANDDSRSAYDGKFYPLDEVLYLTSNKTYVILEQDEEGNNIDFDKDGLILYALRRDGVILESDDWQTYTKAYPRATAPNIVFEEGKGAAGNLGTDEELMWTVYDAPKPFDTISLANQNYGETNFEFIQMPSSTNPLVAIHYPDGYTAAIRTTTLASMTKEEEEEMLRELEVPNTGALQAIVGVAAPSVSIATIIVLGGIYVARKRKN